MNTLTYFPEPYPDEDFRSLVYRYHIRTPNNSLADSIYELFEKKTKKLPLFPNKLKTLLSKLPDNKMGNLEKLISDTTWIRLIQIFMSKDQRIEFTNFIMNGSENPFQAYSKVPGDFFAESVRYCPFCLKDDYEGYGECYVHKKHQIKFMDFCHKHFSKLIDKCPNCDEKLTAEYPSKLLRVPFCKNGHDLTKKLPKDMTPKETEFKYTLFNLLCQMSDNWKTIDRDFMKLKILMVLWKENYIHYKGRVLKKELVDSLLANYDSSLLKEVSIDVRHISHNSFISRILVHKYNKNILFYLLLIHDLFNTYEKFISFEFPIANLIPFGEGPWECINKNCDEYTKKVICKNKRLPKISGGSVITAEFSCPYCGYIYVKRWNVNNGLNEKPMIKTLGHKMIKQILEKYLEGKSALQISTEVNCSEFGVRQNLNRIIGSSNVLKKEDRESVRQIIAAYLETSVSDEFQIKKEKYRLNILEYIKDNKNVSRVEIYKENQESYGWLKRYDKEWLETILPQPLSLKRPSKDLTTYDYALSIKINKISKKLYNEYPYQIKKHTILKKLSSTERSRVSKNQLPLSESTLESQIEPLQNYLIRRLPMAIKNLYKANYKNITLESIKKFNKLYRFCDLETEQTIKTILNNRSFTE
ncbi:TnsD family Tn7-like transposition protein [Falsibacillus pallidus]|uniref:TniQ protein n=1 Tax=Falsibacillus pallidus TaxID=493781 RepID=A0A370G1A8_9BACI|nr:TnsD family Tn7-like transposition protein [Falsibacillus pallidus]RDI37525.1 TniQ protein [Falsibacillus pallidus]